MHKLKSARNANRILQSMSEYLSSFRKDVEKVYYLNKKGREYVGCKNSRAKTQNIGHFLTRNQLFVHLKQPRTWQNELKIKAGDFSVICDAKFEDNGIPVFVEVDCQQMMMINKQKADKYRKLKEMTGQKFYLIWVTEIESRKDKLRKLSFGLPGRVYTLSEIK
ncbi:replication-relaxation family protein [Peribacillus butanolivorans]|uniref:replication-relaxation family protein n=1 Tax=Peribacillus butanolivorans TaxID=421767 RepID=UPI003821E950